MILFPLTASALLILAAILLFRLTPEQVANDILRLTAPKQSLRDKALTAQGRKKSRKLSVEIVRIKDALTATGKGAQFTIVCVMSIILLFCGISICVLIENPFLIPVLGTALCLIPFLFAKNTIRHYEKHVSDEMETALSIISTSYIRSDDIISAVQENISYLKPPVRGIFKAFLGDATAISSNIKIAVNNLRERVDNDIFREWCGCILQCQEDRTLKDTLLPVVNKLTDVRIVNSELQTMISSARSEYYTMAALVAGNIPLLFVLNKDWFETLMYTIPGKITIAVCGLAILITAGLMLKYTQPIQYKR